MFCDCLDNFSVRIAGTKDLGEKNTGARIVFCWMPQNLVSILPFSSHDYDGSCQPNDQANEVQPDSDLNHSWFRIARQSQRVVSDHYLSNHHLLLVYSMSPKPEWSEFCCDSFPEVK